MMNSQSTSPTRAGFTLVELLIVIAIVFILLLVLVPATRHSGGYARRAVCLNNLKNLGLALQNYHEFHGHFPAAMNSHGSSQHRLSGTVALLPYLEQEPLWAQITNPLSANGKAYPAWGPPPTDSSYPAWCVDLPTLHCPNSPGNDKNVFGETNYAFCVGDVAREIHTPTKMRGVFACDLTSRFEDITDGMSCTLFMAEIGTAADRSLVSRFATYQSRDILDHPDQYVRLIDSSNKSRYRLGIPLGSPGRGGRWADGAARYSLFNTIWPPGSPSCAIGTAEATDGIYSAGSFHPGGANVAMADASTRFVTNEIDVGDLSQPTLNPEQMAAGLPSPYGIWGALGTAAADEFIDPDW